MSSARSIGAGRAASSLTPWVRLRLWAQTQLRDSLPGRDRDAVPRQIVFFHVPKCGGTSVKRYLTACLGTRKSGRSSKLSEVFRQPPPDEVQIDRARLSRFVHARCSWSALERLGLAEDVFTFTFLREPRSRVASWHRFVTTYPEARYSRLTADIFSASHGLSPLEMFSTEEPLVRCMVDNFMVRQFAGRSLDYPVAEAEWPALLALAKKRLHALSFIGFNDTYEADFEALVDRLRLPKLSAVPHENATSIDRDTAPVDAPDTPKEDTAVEAALTPLLKWDEQFYDYARVLKARRTPD